MSRVRYATTAADIDALAANVLAQGFGHTGELMLAARRREIAAVFIVGTATPAPIKLLRRSTLPTVCIIGDDPGDAGLGPTGWLATRRLVQWAAYGVLHAAGGTVDHYRRVIDLAKLHRRVLLVESAFARAEEWAAALLQRQPHPLRFLAVLPDGGVHPLTSHQEPAQ